MTPNDIKTMVKKDVVRMQGNHGIATDTTYQKGKVNGMLKAFWIAGLLTDSEWTDIQIDIFKEMF